VIDTDAPDQDEDLVEIRLLNLPVTIQRDASAQYDALAREFTLIRASSDADPTPQRLLALMDELQERYNRFAEAPRSVLQTALAEGSTSVDVMYLLPRAIGDAMAQLGALLDEADEYCRAGQHLVTLAAPPAVLAYRRWFIDEIVRQAAGASPNPWRMPNLEPAKEDDWPTLVAGQDATVEIAGELDLATAPNLRSHLNTLHNGGIRHFKLDTGGVGFIDSVGLSVILALYRRCKEEGGAVTIVSPSRVMRRTLEVD
jgi:anti-anti-sigma factor